MIRHCESNSWNVVSCWSTLTARSFSDGNSCVIPQQRGASPSSIFLLISHHGVERVYTVEDFDSHKGEWESRQVTEQIPTRLFVPRKCLCVCLCVLDDDDDRRSHTFENTHKNGRRRRRVCGGSVLVMMMDLCICGVAEKYKGTHSIAPVCWWHVSSSSSPPFQVLFLERKKNPKRIDAASLSCCSNGIIISMIGFN